MSDSLPNTPAARAFEDISRRRFLRLAGGVAGGALTISLAAACAPTSSTAPAAPTAAPAAAPTTASAPAPASAATSAPAAAAPTVAPAVTSAPAPAPTTAASGGSAVYPSYLPATSGPKPDVPASGPGYDDGFNSFPTNPVKAMPGDPPGTGSTVHAMSIALFPPPTPLDQNPAWQAVNKALNATVQFDVVTQADYPAKLGTVMAGDMPDLLYLYAPANSSSTLAAANGLPQFLTAQAADLTEYLAGDAARDYPNLAAIPTSAWKNA